MFLRYLPYKTQLILYLLGAGWIGFWLHRTVHRIIDSGDVWRWQDGGWSFLWEGIGPILFLDFLVGGMWAMLWFYLRIRDNDLIR